MSSVDPRVAARYNVRAMLPGPADALRDAALRLGVPMHELGTLARHGAVEALAVQGLSPSQSEALLGAVRRTGGDVVMDASRARAIVLAPLSAAGELGATLHAQGEEAAELGAVIAAALMARGTPPPVVAGAHRLDFSERTLVMGIVNVTPDSFSGDGVGDDVPAAVSRALELVRAGADIIDVGGESTRPNSEPITAAAETQRVLPVIAALRDTINVPVSVDTRKAEVAAAAIDAGACMVNDVWGLRADPDMAAVVASHPDTAVCVMHNQHGTGYGDLMGDVASSLRQSLAIAAAAGIAAERVIIDPGFGFAKTPAQNLELVRRLGELRAIGRPILVGPSRKSTIGFLTGSAPQDRVGGSIAITALAVAAGAHMVRTHDVDATVRALRVADAVVRGTPRHILELAAPGPTG